MVVTRWAAVLVMGATSLVSAPSVFAASTATQAFLANLVSNVDFLDRSSRFALKNSKNARLRDFAFGMAREQTIAANAIYDWSMADTNSLVASSTTLKVLDRKDLDRAATGSTKTNGVKSSSPALSQHRGAEHVADERLPRGQEDLDSLEGLEGSAFDTEFKDKQLDALQQIETDYRDYAATGDDPKLKGLAARQLSIIQRRLAQLTKL